MIKQVKEIYQNGVQQVKQFKSINDRMNKRMGIVVDQQIILEFDKEQENCSRIARKVKDVMDNMEKNSLDPDTGRKVATLRKQLSLQERRRQSIRSQIRDLQNTYREKKEKKQMNTENKKEELHQYLLDDKMEQQYMQGRSKMLSEAEQKLHSLNQVMLFTKKITHEQGDKIDVIGEEIQETYHYAKLGRQQVHQSSVEKKHKSKLIIFLVLILLACIVVLILIYFI